MAQRISREGIPWNQYDWVHLLVALPFTVVLDSFWFLIGLTSRVEEPLFCEPLPDNAILVGYHTEWPLYPVSCGLVWHKRVPPWTWVGLHHFASYFGSLRTYLFGAPCFRFRRGSREKPFEHMLRFLAQHPRRGFAIRTDSGGPYEQIRASVVILSQRSGRPVVLFRQKSSRQFRLPNQHWIPLPFGTVTSKFSRVFSCEELATQPVDSALDLLQREMTELA